MAYLTPRNFRLLFRQDAREKSVLTSPTIDGVAAPVAPVVEQQKPVLVYKNQAADTTPQKIHNGYDDEPIAEEPKQRRSGPIFLR